MIRRPIIALLLVVIGSTALLRTTKDTTTETPASIPTGFSEQRVTHDGQSRPYLLYVPKQYSRTNPAPLVIFLHGGGGDMNQAKNYQLQDTADSAGFILVIPNGTGALRPDGRLATWNAEGCCGGARDKNIDDVGFIRTIVETVSEQLSIEATRIYATGMSNGGMMSYRLACEAADVFAAIAPVAGTDGTTTCTPSEPVSVLHIHAKDDTHVLFNGGAGEDAFQDETKVMEFVSVPDTINRWVSYNSLDPSPERTLSVPGAYCDTYSKELTGTEVTLCVTESGGHSWPGSTVGQLLRDKQPSQAISANSLIWEFFKNHPKSR